MPSTRAGRGRPSASNRRNISFLPRPASIRRAVCSVSSNVELPELPDARMETLKEMRPHSSAAQAMIVHSAAKDNGKLPPPRQQFR